MNIRVKMTKAANASGHGVSRGSVVTLDFETYLYGVVATESYSSWHANALKCQAIAARTYALYFMQLNRSKSFDVNDTTSYQSYLLSKANTGSTKAAVNATAGKVLVYSGKAFKAEYASSNGCQSDSAGKPYFRSGYDAYTYRSGRRTKFGHQRGMSQWGMQQAAKEGLSTEAILNYYYPNTSIASNYNGSGSVVTPGVGTSPIANKGTQMVNLARQQIGKPYVLGADGPSSFDCSGLLVYCYKTIGIDLPHGTTSMHSQTKNRTIWTPSNTSAPWGAGDLVFTADPSSDTYNPSKGLYTTHMGMATGQGKKVIEAKGTNSGVVESDWSTRKTLYAVTRVLPDNETTFIEGAGTQGGPGIGGTEIAPIVNVSDILIGVIDPYKEVISQIMTQLDGIGYTDSVSIGEESGLATPYGYLLDLKNAGEFRFHVPEYSIRLSSNYESVKIPGRSSQVQSYEDTTSREVTIEIVLAAGTGFYGVERVGYDPVEHMSRDIQFLQSLLYPDYSRAILISPPQVLLVLGNNDALRGIVTAVDVKYLKPFDALGRHMIAEVSFTVRETLPYPKDVTMIRNDSRRSP